MDTFPQPENGVLVEIAPPPFSLAGGRWCAKAIASSLVIHAGATVVDERVDKNIFVGREALPPGQYRWDVIADERRRGWWNFTIAPDAVKKIVPTAQEVLKKVPSAHPRLMYLPGDETSIVEKYLHKIPTLKRNIELALRDGFPERPLFHRNDVKISRALDYRRTLNRHRDFVDRNLVSCALGYVLLKDKNAGQFARAALMEICDWNPEGPCSS